jgi:hypothetical protein
VTDEQAPAGGEPTAPPAAGPTKPRDGAAPTDGAPAATTGATRPDYKGAPLDPERGPGLGCFWLQTVVFLVLFVLTPFGVVNGWPAWLTTTMFIVTLILLLFVGQTVIFLLRLVAADRRTRRRPLREGARPTVGDLSAASAVQAEPAAEADQAGPPEADGPPAVRQ